MQGLHVRFQIWHLMAVILAGGLIAGGYVRLFPPEPRHWHDFHATIAIAGRAIPHTSPAFWVILSLALAVLVGLFAGLIKVIVRTGRSGRCQ
jgi:hypothetical protein